jgi:hypothetical protein
MVEVLHLRSVSFDTSFLLKDITLVDTAIKALARDHIPCFLTATVVSEVEQLHAWGRITEATYKQAMKRITHSHATVIDFKNRLLSDAFGNACLRSMEKHGVSSKEVVNDCTILVSTLKNGIDLFLSEDFHFTSPITRDVINEVTNAACSEYHLMCETMLYCIDTITFVDVYHKGQIDLSIVRSRLQQYEKKRKERRI